MDERRFYGYKRWILEEVPRCFYVGKGLRGRPNNRCRSHKWYEVVKQCGLRVEICIGPVTNEEACTWEMQNVELMGTFSINRSNDDSK